MPPFRRVPPPSSPPAAARAWWLAGGGIVLAVAVAAWILRPREDKVGAVKGMQRLMLARAGVPDRAAIDALVRTVDRMTRSELGAAYAAAGAEWKRLKQEAVAGYFAAADADRPRLLDEHMARMVAYHDLLVAMNPNATPDSPAILPRQRQRRGEPEPPVPSAAEEEAVKDRLALAKIFDDALADRAKARGVTLPVFR